MIARLDNFNRRKDIRHIDEVVIQYDEKPLSFEMSTDEYRNSLNINFETIDEARQLASWFNQAADFWESQQE